MLFFKNLNSVIYQINLGLFSIITLFKSFQIDGKYFKGGAYLSYYHVTSQWIPVLASRTRNYWNY